MTAARKPRATSQDRKLDELLRLVNEQGERLAVVEKTVGSMAPTVTATAEMFTFARVGRTMTRFFAGAGIGVIALLIFMTDRWHLVGQLFKRVP